MSERGSDPSEVPVVGEGAATAARERAAHAAHASREANERIFERESTSSFLEVICECADPACGRSLAVTREEYEDVRASARQFVVANGHVDSGSEVVVEAYARYVVVRKIGAAAAVAEALHERAVRSPGSRPSPVQESQDAVSP